MPRLHTGPSTPTNCPPPRWTILRELAPDLLDDLTDIWARIEALTVITDDAAGGHLAQLRWSVEHLGTLVEAFVHENILDDQGLHDLVTLDSEPGTSLVFPPSSWRPTAPARWEAAASPHLDVSGAQTFEAILTAEDGAYAWRWDLYRSDGETLDRLGGGHTATLGHAERQADALAQRWRDDPDAMARQRQLARIRATTVLACDGCGTSWTVEDVLLADSCPSGTCASQTFDTFSLDELADTIHGSA